jgi:ribonuclease HII
MAGSPPVFLEIEIERRCWSSGLRLVAGVDEVGRGALAGPLVAAAVVLPPSIADDPARFRGLTDSKLLTPAQREHWHGIIREAAVAVGIGAVDCDELDAVGVGPANRMAMERAVLALSVEPEMLLLDATVVDLGIPQVGFVDGDAICLSIAAASVIAKVTRDRLMTDFDQADSRYSFALHKGYGTPAHLEALRAHGPGPLHRRCFAPVAACIGERRS